MTEKEFEQLNLNYRSATDYKLDKQNKLSPVTIDDVKTHCRKKDREVVGELRPYEIGEHDNIPNWCPLNK